jgi:alanine dehydrogenase
MTNLQPIMVSEDEVRASFTRKDALAVVREAFIAAATGQARNFPVVREQLTGRVFGIKSAVDESRKALGFKAGGAFPENLRLGGAAHQSFVTLIDFELGRVRAIIPGNYITVLRTAAACALSIELMARPDARTLCVLGAGAQAEAHIRAALEARTFDQVSIWSRSTARAEALARLLKQDCDCVAIDNAQGAVLSSDVVITLTPSTQGLVAADWVHKGTHLACMGADTAGKREVDTRLLARARIFTDDVSQAVTIGECQSAVRAGLISAKDILGTLGDILIGVAAGRAHADEITLYDGTGVALQDLFSAQTVLEKVAGAE